MSDIITEINIYIAPYLEDNGAHFGDHTRRQVTDDKIEKVVLCGFVSCNCKKLFKAFGKHFKNAASPQVKSLE